MSVATINQLGFEPPRMVQNRIKMGRALVWLFAIISTSVTLFYWYSLSGLEYSGDENIVKNVIRWLSVGLGLALELAKLYFIFVGGYKKLWISAVIISVITVMGSYSILNQDRQNNLTKASDTYKDARSAREEARKKQSEYAYVANTSIDDLEAELEANNKKGGSNKARRLSGMSYQSFVQKRADINKRIEARRKYDSATATLNQENKNMQQQGLGGSSNPLFNSIGSVFSSTAKMASKIEGGLLIVFFFATSVLAEIFAFYIGEKVREETNSTFLTTAQVQDLKNKELFGIGISEMMPEQFARINDAHQDRIEGDAAIRRLRETRTDENGNPLPAGDIARSVRSTRTDLEEGSRDARNRMAERSNNTDRSSAGNSGNHSDAVHFDLDLAGYSSQDLIKRRDEYRLLKKCPACHATVTGRRKFCNTDHKNRFYQYVTSRQGNSLNGE